MRLGRVRRRWRSSLPWHCGNRVPSRGRRGSGHCSPAATGPSRPTRIILWVLGLGVRFVDLVGDLAECLNRSARAGRAGWRFGLRLSSMRVWATRAPVGGLWVGGQLGEHLGDFAHGQPDPLSELGDLDPAGCGVVEAALVARGAGSCDDAVPLVEPHRRRCDAALGGHVTHGENGRKRGSGWAWVCCGGQPRPGASAATPGSSRGRRGGPFGFTPPLPGSAVRAPARRERFAAGLPAPGGAAARPARRPRRPEPRTAHGPGRWLPRWPATCAAPPGPRRHRRGSGWHRPRQSASRAAPCP